MLKMLFIFILVVSAWVLIAKLDRTCASTYKRTVKGFTHTKCANGVVYSISGTQSRPVPNPDGTLLTCPELSRQIQEYCEEVGDDRRGRR